MYNGRQGKSKEEQPNHEQRIGTTRNQHGRLVNRITNNQPQRRAESGGKTKGIEPLQPKGKRRGKEKSNYR